MKKILALICAATICVGAAAQQSPSTVRFLVGNIAGGTNDILTRVVAAAYSNELKVTTVVENISGASGQIAANKLLSMPEDGSSMLMAGTNQVLIDVINNTEKMKELAPVTAVANTPLVLVGRNNLPAKNANELITLIRKPGTRLTIAGGGSGTTPHMAAATLQRQTKGNLPYIPYRGAPQIIPDVMGGHVDLAVLVLSAAISSIRDGSIRAYGLFSKAPSSAAPEIPLLSEVPELKGLEPIEIWFGLYAHGKTPQAVRDRMAASTMDLLKSDAARQAIIRAGATPMGLDPAATARLMDSDAALYRRLIKSNNLKLTN